MLQYIRETLASVVFMLSVLLLGQVALAQQSDEVQSYRSEVQRYLLQEERSKSALRDGVGRVKVDEGRFAPIDNSRLMQLVEGTPSAADRPGEIHLTVDYATLRIGRDDVRLRTYNGKPIGPVIRAKAGEMIFITLRNQLPLEPEVGHGQNTHHIYKPSFSWTACCATRAVRKP